MSSERYYTVLVVDGNDVGFAKMARDMMNFSQANFVISHKSPIAALECLWEERWHALVVDAPELRQENFEFIQAVREVKPTLPVICVTDDEDLDKAEQAVLLGCESVYIRRAIDGVTLPMQIALAQVRLKAKTARMNTKPFMKMLDAFAVEVESHTLKTC